MLENRFLYISDFSLKEKYIEITTESAPISNIAARLREWAGVIRLTIGVGSPVVILVNIFVHWIPWQVRAPIAVISLLLLPLVFLRIRVKEEVSITAAVSTSVEANVK